MGLWGIKPGLSRCKGLPNLLCQWSGPSFYFRKFHWLNPGLDPASHQLLAACFCIALGASVKNKARRGSEDPNAPLQTQ